MRIGTGLWLRAKRNGGGPTPPDVMTPIPMTEVSFQDVEYRFYDAPTGGSATTAQVMLDPNGFPMVLEDANIWFETDKPSDLVTAAFTGGVIDEAGQTTPGSYDKQFRTNGMMKNPFFFNGSYDDGETPASVARLPQGFDERFAYYAAGGGPTGATCQPWGSTTNIDPGATGQRVQLLEGSFVKCISRVDMTIPTPWRQVEQTATSSGWSVLTVIQTPPPVGSFCPAVAATSKVPYVTTAMRNKAALGDGFATPAGSPTLAEAEAAGNFPYAFLPQFGWAGEVRRRVWPDFPGSATGYSRDWSQSFSDYIGALCAVGQGVDDQYLNRVLAHGQQMHAMYDRGHISRGGAGQNGGQKMFAVLFSFVFKDVAGVWDKGFLVEGSSTHQYFTVEERHVGTSDPYPNANHYTFGAPARTSSIGRSRWFHGGLPLPLVAVPSNYSDEFNADYETTAGVANFPEQLVMASFQNGQDGVDGAAALHARHPAIFPHMDNYRTVDTSNYSTTVRSARATAFYDARRDAFSVPRQAMTPSSGSQVSGLTAATGSATFDYTTMGESYPPATAAETTYSQDGIQWSSAPVTGLTGTVPDMIPQLRHFVRRRRENTAGWGSRSLPYGAGSQSITARITGSVTAGSRTLTVTSVNTANGPLRNGDLVAGPGIVPGTYISAFGTGAGGTGTGAAGTYTLSSPASDDYSGILYSFPPTGVVTPTGTQSGATAWAEDPKLFVATYPAFSGPLFTEIATGDDLGIDSIVYIGTGIVTGVYTPPIYRMYRNGSLIDTANSARYNIVSADLGTTLQPAVVINDIERMGPSVAVAGAAYPAFDLTAFDGANDYLLRTTAFSGGMSDGKKGTFAIRLSLTGGNGVAKVLARFYDAAGTSSADTIFQVDRTASGAVTVTARAGGVVVFSRTSSTTLTDANGEVTLKVSFDLATASYHFYLGNTAMTMGSVTGTLADINWSGIVRTSLMGTIAGTALVPANLRYTFFHPDYIDLSVEGNRDKLEVTGIGNQGEGVFGTPALVMLYGNATTIGNNFGTGGPFTVVGSPE